jgi:hypothetical protein
MAVVNSAAKRHREQRNRVEDPEIRIEIEILSISKRIISDVEF